MLITLTRGLGIGTSATALIKHGVKVDTVEIDPVVHKYASEYFGLPSNHASYIEDAVKFIDRAIESGSDDFQYNYILHDVFTGGAVPANLFTREIFTALSKLLKPDGVIAIVCTLSNHSP
jgi:spermidine synthase